MRMNTPYTIRDVIELCQELNGEILLEEESRETTQPEYILDLHKDEILLERMMEKASAAIPPEAGTTRLWSLSTCGGSCL